ncbi:MAG: DUF4402 domain-containing protein [Algoriphagus aquaeductus]|uniref:DUF4402 domain-containing protein n=1 Tax=Algoriphagus aquaeductus TaxID=475299 RepID=UPI00391C8489
MKTILKSVLTLALASGLVLAAQAQKASTAQASATILADLTIDLDVTQNAIAFGNLSANTPGNVVLDANGTSNLNTGSVTNVARFDLAGADASVTVSYDPTVTLTITGGGTATMVMTPQVVGDALSTNQSGALAVASGSQVTLSSGLYFLWVGGTIPQLNNQTTGSYEGTFNINVEYN